MTDFTFFITYLFPLAISPFLIFASAGTILCKSFSAHIKSISSYYVLTHIRYLGASANKALSLPPSLPFFFLLSLSLSPPSLYLSPPIFLPSLPPIISLALFSHPISAIVFRLFLALGKFTPGISAINSDLNVKRRQY